MASSTANTTVARVRALLTSEDAVAGTQVKAPERVLDALGQLDAVTVNEAMLRQTKIVFVVKEMLKVDHPGVATASKNLLRKWRDILSASSGTSGTNGSPSGSAANTSTSSSNSSSSTGGSKGTVSTPPPNASTSTPPVSRTGSQSSPPSASASPLAGRTKADPKALVKALAVYYGGGMKRQKPAELLASALMTGEQSQLDVELIAEVASNVEKALFELVNGNPDDQEYKEKIRSLVSNLRQNQKLRVSTLTEQIPAKRLCTMTPMELASDEIRTQLDAMYKEIVADSMAPKPVEAPTDMFQCSRCKKRRTSYRQAQTRSADEPMTVFITCLECGHRWRQ